MANEIRCSMCSKNNPAEAAVCSFCGARLTPLGSAGPEPAAELPDWLNDFSASPDETVSKPVAEDADLPDWMKEFRGESDSAPESSPFGSAGNETPDWLNAFSLDDTADQPAPQQEQPQSTPIKPAEESDWLNNFRAERPTPAEAPVSEPSAESGFDSLDWLDRPPQDETSPSTPVEPGFFSGQESSFESGQESGQAFVLEPGFESGADDDVMSWLKNLDGQNSANLFTDQSTQPPDTLNWSEDALENSKKQQTGVTEWLSSLAHETRQDEQTPESINRFQDWLANDQVLREDGLTESPEQPAGEVPAEGAELPAWLAGAAALGAASEETEAQPGAEPNAPEVPDFAAMFGDEQSVAEPTFNAEIFGEQAEPERDSITTPLAWPEQPISSEPAPQAAEISLPSQDEKEADWMAAFAKAPSDEEQIGEVAAPLPFVDEEAPAWLSSVAPPSVPAVPAGPPALIDDTPEPQLDPSGDPFRVELPDWLGESQPAQAEPAVAAGGLEEEPAELAPAELPGWVEELRPLESIIPGEAVVAAAAAAAAGREEKMGPLAGLRGVLAGEDLAVRFRKLPTYSARLRVSERQRSHAAILQNVLDMESIPREIPPTPSQAPQYIYRLVIAAVLMVALLAGMVFTDGQIFAPPRPAASDTGLNNLYQQIESLPLGAPVLLAVDYEPGLSGEMQLAATSVIEHLMRRDLRIAIVSTVPTGPLLAQDLLNLVHPRNAAFNLAERTANLGYLPGGTTSLLEFARSPYRAAPQTYDGQMVWTGPALAGISAIQNFSLVLVLTDSAETGRAWVEQVQPLLGDTPLSMVASAQAGPMLLPYHGSGQITGLVTGYIGGVMYEQQLGSIAMASLYWSSYQWGFLAGILMLIVGGIISALLTAANKPRKARG